MSDEEKTLLERCPIKVVDGHLEADCETKEDRDELAAAFDQEAILRVKPKVAAVPPAEEPES